MLAYSNLLQSFRELMWSSINQRFMLTASRHEISQGWHLKYFSTYYSMYFNCLFLPSTSVLLTLTGNALIATRARRQSIEK